MQKYDLLLGQLSALARRQKTDLTPLMSQIEIEVMGGEKGQVLSPDTMKTASGVIKTYHPKKVKAFKLMIQKSEAVKDEIPAEPKPLKPFKPLNLD